MAAVCALIECKQYRAVLELLYERHLRHLTLTMQTIVFTAIAMEAMEAAAAPKSTKEIPTTSDFPLHDLYIRRFALSGDSKASVCSKRATLRERYSIDTVIYPRHCKSVPIKKPSCVSSSTGVSHKSNGSAVSTPRMRSLIGRRKGNDFILQIQDQSSACVKPCIISYIGAVVHERRDFRCFGFDHSKYILAEYRVNGRVVQEFSTQRLTTIIGFNNGRRG